MTKPKAVVIKQEVGAEVSAEVLAREISAIAAGIKRLRAGRLNERAIVLLIQHASPSVGYGYKKQKPISATIVRAVLEGMESLEATYLRKAAPRG